MFRRRKARPAVSAELRDLFVSFRRTVAAVEAAKRSLAAAAPHGRSPGVPLAEALAGFEEGLREASASMASWRRPEVEKEWHACSEGLDEALRRAERLRLGAAPEGYEHLYGELEDLMDPLEAFASAVERFRQVGP